MYPTAGAEDRTKKTRFSKGRASVSILRKWTRNSGLRNAAGQIRTLSFLVCRIRGFEGLVASYAADPEGLCRFVRRGTAPLADAVRAHGGTMDRVFAGGFSAFFDAPRETGDHTLKACECAAAMLAAVEELNRRQAGAEPLRIGIGLNTGPAILGNFGTEDRPHYAAVGRPAENADTLERLSATDGATLLVGHTTPRQTARSFAFLQVDHFSDGEGDALPVSALLAPPLSCAHPKFLALKSFHAHMFEAFHARNWSQARNLIAQCRALSGANPVLYDFYLRRIAHYEANPPAADWNGILMPVQS